MATHLSFRQGVQECIPTLLGYAGVGIFHLVLWLRLKTLVF